MFSSTLVTALLAACIGVSAAPQEIWSPKILTPTSGTVWTVNSVQTVTWDTSDAPASITNEALIVFSTAGKLDFDHPLAKDFDLRSGSQMVIVPDVAPGDDYSIVLFGSSDNASPEFTISA